MRNVFEYYDEGTYLEHHGIRGQKWGVRRFQNPDGSLTAEGQKRYNAKGAKGIKGFDEDAYAESKRRELKKTRQAKSDADNEKELKAAYRAWEKEDFDRNGSDEKTMIKIYDEISEYSTGRRGSPAKSKAAKAFDKKYEKFIEDNYDSLSNTKEQNKFRSEREKLRLEYCGIALKDIGFKDTEKNRRYIYGLLWDAGNLPIPED